MLGLTKIARGGCMRHLYRWRGQRAIKWLGEQQRDGIGEQGLEGTTDRHIVSSRANGYLIFISGRRTDIVCKHKQLLGVCQEVDLPDVLDGCDSLEC